VTPGRKRTPWIFSSIESPADPVEADRALLPAETRPGTFGRGSVGLTTLFDDPTGKD